MNSWFFFDAFFAAGGEGILQPLLIQLVVIILAARAGAFIARKLRQPSVVGEIVAGLLLGPSCFAAVFPDLFGLVFQPLEGADSVKLEAALTTLSQIGLIFLLFLIGLEFDFSHIRYQGRAAAAISITGVVAPFIIGFTLATLMLPRLALLDPLASFHARSFAIFMGTAMSITAIPILGRILIELGMQRTPIGTTVIASAACDDAVGWILLAAVTSLAIGNFQVWNVITMAGSSIFFLLVLLYTVRPFLLPWLEKEVIRGHGRLLPGPLAILLTLLFVCAIATSAIGIFAIFGAFLFGAVLSGKSSLREAISGQLNDFVTIFFLPIFFTYTGLRTNIGTLTTPESWFWCALVMAAAVLGKWGGCGLAARLSGMPRKEAACVGILMNTRALMELIVINIGMDLGVIPPSVYCMLVLMAVGTTLMATPLAVRMLRNTPYEKGLVERGFL